MTFSNVFFDDVAFFYASYDILIEKCHIFDIINNGILLKEDVYDS